MDIELVPGADFAAQVKALLHVDYAAFKMAAIKGDMIGAVGLLPLDTRRALLAELRRQLPTTIRYGVNDNPRIVAETLINCLEFIG